MLLRKRRYEANARRRHRDALVRKRRLRLLGAIVLVLTVATAWTVMSLADNSTAQVADAELLVPATPSDSSPVDSLGSEHPVFCRLDGKNVVLPVPAGTATIIAYSPLSDERAFPFTPIGERVNESAVARGLSRVFSGDSTIRYHVFSTKGRVVAETAAVAIGAPEGTPVMSPVSGEVVAVKEYKLHGKYDDVQIDIRPQGVSDVIISILLLDEPAVIIGERVEAGKTCLGEVRAPVGELGSRIAEITRDSGSHVHLQVTRSPLE